MEKKKRKRNRDGKQKGGQGAPSINIKNRQASRDFKYDEEFVAGIKLVGSEVKSIAAGNASIADAYAYVNKGEVFVKNMYIKNFTNSENEHDPNRERKLLLTKKEIAGIEKELKSRGTTLVVTKIFNKKGLIKVQLQLATGKNNVDKRNDIKERDAKRQMARDLAKD